MDQFTLSGLYVYPVKSLGGISLKEANVEKKGLQYDRRWMLVDEDGTFVSQRKHHELALLKVELVNDRLTVTHRNDPQRTVSFSVSASTGRVIPVTIWDDHTHGTEVSTEANEWFSSFMDKKVILVRMEEEEKRHVDPRYAKNKEIVSFADGYPFLIISQASLDGLNTRLDRPLQMDRFRPNFVFTGGEPHIEDTFAAFKIGGIQFKAVKPCARCVLITVDQQTAEKGAEPLRTLAGYRTLNKKIMFGQNLIHNSIGIVRLGDQIEVDSWKERL